MIWGLTREEGIKMSKVNHAPATDEELRRMDQYWRAANYLTACQLYLLDNPLLEQPLTSEHIKKRLNFGCS